MAKRYFIHTCDDMMCPFCQNDDADAAFWDEFFYRLDKGEEDVQKPKKHWNILEDDNFEDDLPEFDLIMNWTPDTVDGD